MSHESREFEGKRNPLKIGRYEVITHLASGGMGAVYKAFDTQLQRFVALKVLSPDFLNQPNILERFRREARSAFKLNHENVVSVYEFGEYQSTYFLAMEYINGINLLDYLKTKEENWLSPEEAKRILIQAAKALDHAHRFGIVHRDVKPSNFILCWPVEVPVIKLTDFGLAREYREEDFRITQDNTTLGTIDYMSPEQAQDCGKADPRSDLYSLGCTFFHLLTGNAPFAMGSMSERLLKHREAEVPDVRQINPAVPDGMWNILLRLLAKKPEDRYPSALELLRDLESPMRFHAYVQTVSELQKRQGRDGSTLVTSDSTILLKREILLPEDIGLKEEVEPPALPPVELPVHEEKKAEPAPIVKAPELPRKLAGEPAAHPEPPAPPKVIKTEPIKKRKPEPRRDISADANRKKPVVDAKPPAPTKPRVKSPEEKQAVLVAKRRKWFRQKLKDYGLIGSAGVVVVSLAIFGVVWLTRESAVDPKKKEEPEAKITDPIPPIPIAKKEEIEKKKELDSEKKKETTVPVAIDTRMGPFPSVLRMLSQASVPADTEAYAKEVMGAQGVFPRPSEKAKTIIVSRAPRPQVPESVTSLADALARAEEKADTVIEIHDQGPFYIGSWPRLERRKIFLRAGAGYRPTLAWDRPVNAKSTSWAMIAEGSLVIENLDVVLKTEKVGEALDLFHLQDSSFACRGCTFSQAGKQAETIKLIRIENSVPALEPNKIQFRECFIRGPDWTVLDTRATPCDCLVEGCLFVGGDAPLFHWVGSAVETQIVRVLRSTLVANKQLMIWEPSGPGVSPAPYLEVHAWDALLARGRDVGSGGSMVVLGGEAVQANVRWKAKNSLYAGWKQLLKAPDQTVSTLEAWQGRFLAKEDGLVPDPWPGSQVTHPGELTSRFFFPHDDPVGFAAQSGPGPLGSDFQRLPPAPAAWMPTIFGRLVLPPLAFADPPLGPAPAPSEESYVGERIDLAIFDSKFDLGQYLMQQLQAKKPAPQVVVDLVGKGPVTSSPIQVKGFRLSLSFQTVREPKAEPLELVQRTSINQAPLFDISDGTLEVVNGRFKLDAGANAATLFRVSQGSLLLTRCQLKAPLSNAPDAFKALIQCQGDVTGPTTVAMKECILITGKSLFHLEGPSVRIRLRQSLLLAMEDVVEWIPPAEVRPESSLSFEYNTLAFHRSFVSMGKCDEMPIVNQPAVIQASGNYIFDPLGRDMRQTSLLSMGGDCLAKRFLLWQGKGNVFDRGALKATSFSSDKSGFMSEWNHLWGSSGELKPILVDTLTHAKSFTPEALPLTLLALPPNVAVSVAPDPPPGADLLKLGITKKK